MPHASACGLYWNFAADDLVVPAMCNMAFKGACTVALGFLVWSVYHAGQLQGECQLSKVHVYIYGLWAVLFVGVWVSNGCHAATRCWVHDRRV